MLLRADTRPRRTRRAGWSCGRRPTFASRSCSRPPHRKAVCLEPYTCVTDAANLQARGIDAGWRELPAGGAVGGDGRVPVEPGGVNGWRRSA